MSMKSKSTVTALLVAMTTTAQAASIAEIASSDDRFSTLVSAAETAGLLEILNRPGHFTVYAPINDAFSDLPQDTFSMLMLPENRDRLTDILLYHVDDRTLRSNAFPLGSNFFRPLLETERLCITSDMSGVTIADGTGELANVIVADIEADNGIIHVIDKVLLPGTRPDCH